MQIVFVQDLKYGRFDTGMVVKHNKEEIEVLKNHPRKQEVLDKWFDQVREKLKKKQEDEPIAVHATVITNGKWVDGEYYAHEYDRHVAGRARYVKYKDLVTNELIHEAIEVECLDKSLSVADGLWDIDDYSAGTASNGMGDEIELEGRLK